jgi:hypothetical protein
MSTTPTRPQVEGAPENAAPATAVFVVLRGLLGALAGGAIGLFLFQWLARNGFYAMMIPGALLGLGSGLAARGRSLLLGILCAVAALCLSVYAEWVHAPFKEDGSFLFFLTHLHQLDGAAVKYVMMGLGALFAFWFGQGR